MRDAGYEAASCHQGLCHPERERVLRARVEEPPRGHHPWPLSIIPDTRPDRSEVGAGVCHVPPQRGTRVNTRGSFDCARGLAPAQDDRIFGGGRCPTARNPPPACLRISFRLRPTAPCRRIMMCSVLSTIIASRQQRIVPDVIQVVLEFLERVPPRSGRTDNSPAPSR